MKYAGLMSHARGRYKSPAAAQSRKSAGANRSRMQKDVGLREDVDIAHVRGRRRRCRNCQGRPGHTEREDSGNDDGSPDAHDSSMEIPEVRGEDAARSNPQRRISVIAMCAHPEPISCALSHYSAKLKRAQLIAIQLDSRLSFSRAPEVAHKDAPKPRLNFHCEYRRIFVT